MQLAMMLALLTAQRQGDIIKFRWLDIRGMDLHVQQSKTRKRIAIAINAELEAVLDRCWLLPGGGKDGSEYIIPTRTGKPYTSEGFRACWQRTINRAMRGRPAYRRRKDKPVGALTPAIRERFTFHDIRALAATKCATPEIAMRLLGHASMAMTMRVYRRGIEHVDALEVA
jgi:integrase